LNAVLLPEFGWYRIDPRGNRSGVDAQFDPPNEKLAWHIAVKGERDLRGVWADPLSSVITVLKNYDTWEGVRDHLPDLPFHGRDIRYQAVILKDHHVLLLRIEEEDQAFWVIPGGGREGLESEEECVIREVWEETHLQVEVERLILDEKVPQDPFYERHKTYLCQIIKGVARPGIEPEVADAESPIKDIGWFDLRAVNSWDALGASPPFAFSLLKRIREKLGYARGI
jgi:8-oxo-dGTP pyrophosphatase MutT (NUDIX family)